MITSYVPFALVPFSTSTYRGKGRHSKPKKESMDGLRMNGRTSSYLVEMQDLRIPINHMQIACLLALQTRPLSVCLCAEIQDPACEELIGSRCRYFLPPTVVFIKDGSEAEEVLPSVPRGRKQDKLQPRRWVRQTIRLAGCELSESEQSYM